jgi:hypothetical protein
MPHKIFFVFCTFLTLHTSPKPAHSYLFKGSIVCTFETWPLKINNLATQERRIPSIWAASAGLINALPCLAASAATASTSGAFPSDKTPLDR